MKKKSPVVGAMLIVLGIIGFSLATVQGQEAPPVSPPAGPPPVQEGQIGNNAPALMYVAPGVFEIGKCRIIKAKGMVEFPASANMKEGLLEYLLVGNTGKLHESLLRTDVEPYALQVALLLSGLEGSLSPLSFQGENKLPEGDAVDIVVRWEENGKEKNARIEDLVLQDKKPVPQVPWVFTGSIIRDGVFAAQVEKSMIALFHDPVAMIDHRLQSGDNDEGWTVNTQAAPPVGTPMIVTITKK